MTPYVIVFGNEKGGTGKSTAAMHVAIYLANSGFRVGTLDIDARQGTLSRYVANREKYNQDKNTSLPLTSHQALLKSDLSQKEDAEKKDEENLQKTIESFADRDFLIIDTPGSDTHLSRTAHTYADSLITPLNDSFIDLDMLVKVDRDSLSALKPSTYAETVWEQRKMRALQGRKAIDWVVMRNRLTNIASKNKEQMNEVLGALSKRIGFRLASGFGERVIFRELFLSGLTVMDLDAENLSLSHVAARQELRGLIQMLNLPETLRPS